MTAVGMVEARSRVLTCVGAEGSFGYLIFWKYSLLWRAGTYNSLKQVRKCPLNCPLTGSYSLGDEGEGLCRDGETNLRARMPQL